MLPHTQWSTTLPLPPPLRKPDNGNQVCSSVNEEFFSYRPPTKGHVAHPHSHEQPLGTHTLPDEAHLRVHDIVYQVLEKNSAPNFCESRVHL